MTRELAPGMAVRHSQGWWIVFAVTDGQILEFDGKMRSQTYRLGDGAVALLCFDEEGKIEGFGWEVRRNSATWEFGNEYEVFG